MMKRHPLAVKYMPEPKDEEINSLKSSIADAGFDGHYPIITLDGMVLVGWTRYLVCQQLKILPPIDQYKGDDPVTFLALSELNRRQLSTVQKMKIAEGMRPTLEKEAEKRMKAGTLGQNCARVSETVAKAAGVSKRTADKFHAVEVNGTPELQDAVQDGDISISDAAEVAKDPPAKQRAAVKAVKSGKTKTAQAAVKPKKSGSVKYDDRFFEDTVKKLHREMGKRKDALGGVKQYEECCELLNSYWTGFQRWQRITT